MRDTIVAEALTWQGTPFHHMGRVKGVGVDCVGLVLGVAKTTGLNVTDVKNYPRYPINGVFQNAVDSQTVPISFTDILPGDLMEFNWGREPQHIAIVVSTTPMRIIHALSAVNMCVVDDFDIVWQRRFVCARRFKELA